MPPSPASDETRLDQALSRLYRFHPKKIDLSLERVETLLRKLGNPERNLPPVFHVAGTNGKGSVVAFLGAILKAAGLTVHVYTSPHLVSFRERIRVAGNLIDQDELVDILERIETVNGDDPITFFEITTAAAFVAFAETPADVCLLEVGLGGRLDATNVIKKPLVSIITPIGLDHAAFLGDDLRSVAREKAGIAKAGVPLVAAHQAPEVLAEIEKHTVVLLEGRDWQINPDIPIPALIGDHQFQNAALAIAALSTQDTLAIPPEAINTGLKTVRWPARFQKLEADAFQARLQSGADVWLDGGHNPLAGGVLAETLGKTIDPARPLYLIVGMMEGKDADGFLAPMAPLVAINGALFAITVPGKEKCIAPEDLAKTAQRLGLAASAVDGVEDALEDISRLGGAAPQILITGSLYLAGQVLRDINFQIT